MAGKRLILQLFILIALFFSFDRSDGQVLKRISPDNTIDSLYRMYKWFVTDGHHGAYINLALFKNNTFKYYSSFPLGKEDSSEGTYAIKGKKLILNSFLQRDSIQIEVRYVDTPLTRDVKTRLYIPFNEKGEAIWFSHFALNYDTTFQSLFYPASSPLKPAPDSIYSIKLYFLLNSGSSPWTTVLNNGKNIQVIVKTDKNLDEYAEVLFENFIFTVKGNRLVAKKSLLELLK